MAKSNFEDFFSEGKKPLEKKDVFVEDNFIPQKVAPIDSGIFSALKRGLKKGTAGVLTGFAPEETPPDASFLEKLAEGGGEIASDVPGFIGGGVLGGVGGPMGSAVGAFGLPTAIKESAKQIRKGMPEGVGDVLGRIKQIGLETGKSGLVGAATGAAARIVPLLPHFPAAQKVLSTPLRKGLASGALELGALTGSSAALQGESPTAEDIAINALLLGGVKGAAKVAKRIPDWVKPKESKVFQRANMLLPDDISEKVLGKLKNFKKQSEYFDFLKDHVGEREAQIVESQFNWRDELTKAQTKKEWSKKELNDMIYYRQRSANPTIEGDTHFKLAERLPKSAKKFVDTVVDKHFKDSLKVWNEDPIIKRITPRAGLEEIYLPGLYKNPNPKVYNKVINQLKVKNPFTNRTEFLTYYDAFTKAGLKPRYEDLPSLLKAFDKIMITTKANTKLVANIRNLEGISGENKLIVTADNPTVYAEARANKFVAFDDPLLRGEANGKSGKLSPHPALVDPNLAKSIQGVFNKRRYEPDHWGLQKYDTVSDAIKFARVAFSPFHYLALSESAFGALGPRGLNFPTIKEEGGKLRENKDFMKRQARAVLGVGSGIDNLKKASTLFDKGIEKVKVSLNTRATDKAFSTLAKANNYLFDEFHPNLKAYTFNTLANEGVERIEKQRGTPLSPKEKLSVDRQVASFVNDIYGGQNWQTTRLFNDPRRRKFLRRVIAYPDWSLSTIRQAQSAFATGLRGRLGRAYWLRYGAMFGTTHALLKWFNSGIKRNEEGEWRFDVLKANKGITDSDPTKWYQFPLPDISVKVGGKVYNPSRDERGKRLYAHIGKQMLEIGRYFTDPFSSVFGKANPLIQIAFKQIVGGTPYKGKIIPARGKWSAGDFKAWDASDPWSVNELSSRAKEVFTDMTPFGFKNLVDKGIAPYVATGLGAFPISKGISTFTAEPLIKKALKNKDVVALNKIRRALIDNKVPVKAIRRTISKVRNTLKSQ